MNMIYTMWWQGFEHAPEIIKICHNSLLKHYNPKTQKIIELNKDNYREYVDLPDYILNKAERGIISLTHLSDIIRFMLLQKTGGMWVDATMLFTKAIEDSCFFEREFFTMKNPKARNGDMTSKWECFFIAGKKDFPLFPLLVNFWLEYWKKEDDLIAYLLTDHLFYIGYQTDEEIRKAIDACPEFFYPIDYFQRIVNREYKQEILEELIYNEPFIKMSYKYPLKEYADSGKMSYYGYLKEVYL